MHDDLSPSAVSEQSVDCYKHAILEDGYTIIKNAVGSNIVEELLCKLRHIISTRKQYATYKTSEEGGGYLTDLQNEEVMFIKVVFGEPILRSLLIALLNDPFYRNMPKEKANYIFRGIRALDDVAKGLPLHIDSVLPSSSRYPTGISSSFILENHDRNNGCTLVVPKTHRSDTFADRSASDRVVAIEAKAGDVVVWDTRLWHGTEDNPQRNSRLSLLCTFTSWHLKQPLRHYDTLPNHIYQQLTDEEKSIIGFCSIPARDNFESHHDAKFGYECLAEEI